MTSEAPPPATELMIELFPIERWARIRASIDLSPGSEAAVLEASHLTSDEWESLDERWLAHQDEALARGDTSSLHTADDAYLARVEEERGTVTADEYAALIAAAERGTAEQVLAELGIPSEAVVVVERVWCRRARQPQAQDSAAVSTSRSHVRVQGESRDDDPS